MGAVEAACIGRSVAKWTWKRFSAKAFSEPSRRHVDARAELKSGRKPKRGEIRCSASMTATNEQARPWIAEGISRRDMVSATSARERRVKSAQTGIE